MLEKTFIPARWYVVVKLYHWLTNFVAEYSIMSNFQTAINTVSAHVRSHTHTNPVRDEEATSRFQVPRLVKTVKYSTC